MKLSEAILLGSVGSKQGFGASSLHSYSQRKCALGAAILAVGIDDTFYALVAVWPWLNNKMICPDCNDTHITIIKDVIWHLNDDHRWTRPQIAAWVATIEPSDIVAPVVEQEQVSSGI